MPDFPPRTDFLLSDIHITPSTVSAIISKLDPHKACKLTGTLALDLNKCAPGLAHVLSKLYNKCFDASYFPAYWKSSSVVSIFKNSGELADPSNYQPINLPLFGKILKAQINSELVKHFTLCGLLSDKYYGFCFFRSTTDVLTIITEKVCQVLHKNGKAQAVALDVTKTFDRGWPASLFHKLKGYGVSGQISDLIQSFLTNHAMKVVLNNHSSRYFHIKAGVL